jgi:hypothetical protein
MKFHILLALTLGLLTGCISTQFETYRGQAVFDGKGGAVRNVSGIDIWDVGEPDCKYQIIGYIRQDTEQNGGLLSRAIASSASESEMVDVAKKHGGDGIIFVSSSSRITGAHTFNSGYVTANGSSATYVGGADTQFSTSEQRLVAVVKYLKQSLEPTATAPSVSTNK